MLRPGERNSRLITTMVGRSGEQVGGLRSFGRFWRRTKQEPANGLMTIQRAHGPSAFTCMYLALQKNTSPGMAGGAGSPQVQVLYPAKVK